MDNLSEIPNQAWSCDQPPTLDPLFRLAVMARIEQRRFRRGITIQIGLAGICAAAGWILAPQIESIVITLGIPLAVIGSLTWAALHLAKYGLWNR